MSNLSRCASLLVRPLSLLIFGVCLFFIPVSFRETSSPPKKIDVNDHARVKAVQAIGNMPLTFEANRGQTDQPVDFIARSEDSAILLSAAEINLIGEHRGHELRIGLAGANTSALPTGDEPLPGTVNYLYGNDPSRWLTDVPTFAKVRYEAVYPGIDLVYYSKDKQLEYDLVISPQTDPDIIRLDLHGQKPSIDQTGALILGERAALKKPLVYQDVDGERREIVGSYKLHGDRSVGFDIGEYDKELPLVIDPVLSYSRVISGDGANVGNGIAVDNAGNAYVVGTTSSNNFPTMNPFQPARAGFIDTFVMKLDPNGNLLYSTFIGGSNDDIGRGIAIDANGNAYITGWTFSTNFPTANAFQAARNTSPDAFVAKLNSAGSGLVYSTYLGGGGDDRSYAIAVDTSSDVLITGQTFSSNFPISNASQGSRNGTGDIFVTKFNPSGSALGYSTYLGGAASFEIGNGIAVDSDGNAYVVGQTASTDFPVLNAFQATKGDGFTGSTFDAFLTKFDPSGGRVFSTYLGGDFSDIAYDVDLDASRNIYLTGMTSSSNFPLLNAVQPTVNGTGTEAFITRFNASGSTLGYSTLLGGNADETALGIVVDPITGAAAVTGKTNSPDFPAVRSIQSTGGGGTFRSSDGGATWQYANKGLTSPFGTSPAQTVNGLAIDPIDSSVYAATGGGVYKSHGAAPVWSVIYQDYTTYSVTVEPQNPGIIFAGNFGRVSKSVDSGQTWSSSTAGLPFQVVNKIAVDRTNDSNVFAALGTGSSGGVYKSTDGGNTWNVAAAGLANLAANTVVQDPVIPPTMYVGTGYVVSTTAGVYKSTDSGGSWTRMSTGLSNQPVLALAIDPTNSNTLYAATLGGVYKSTDGASSWTQFLQTAFSVLSIAIDPNDANKIYIGTETFSGQGIIRSTDGGATWAASGLTDTRVSSILIDPFTSEITAGCGMLSSSDPSTDVFVSAIGPGGSPLAFSSYLGGTGRDEGHGIGFDGTGNIYITGNDYSIDFPAPSPPPPPPAADLESTDSPVSILAGSIPAKDPSCTTVVKVGGAYGTSCPEITLNIPNPSCDMGVLCQKLIYVHGGTPEYTLSKSSGVLPPGLELTSDGEIKGVATQVGTFNFTVEAVDSRGCVGSKSFAYTIHPKPVVPLQIEKVPAEDAYDPVNKTVTFLVTVANNSATAPDVLVRDEGYHGVATNVPAGWTCFNGSSTITCKRENMPQGAVTFTFVMDVPRAVPGDKIINSADVTTIVQLSTPLTDRTATSFTIPAPPTITMVMPSSGPVGTSCDIDGIAFCEGGPTCSGNPPTVKFSGIQAELTCATSDTHICTQVPVGASTGDMCVSTSAGQACVPFTVTTLTPTPTPTPGPPATVTGRVTDPAGRGLRNALVTLIDQAGNRRSVLTSSLGFYSFDGVATPQTYSIVANSKRFRFSPVNNQLIMADANFDFAGIE